MSENAEDDRNSDGPGRHVAKYRHEVAHTVVERVGEARCIASRNFIPLNGNSWGP